MGTADSQFCPTCRQPRLDEHDRLLPGTGRVLVALTAHEIETLLTGVPGPTLVVRMLIAMQLIDDERAQRLAHEGYEIALHKPR